MNYRYKARDKYGKSTTGIINGEDKSSVAKHLSALGYIPISIEEAREMASAIPNLFSLFNIVRPEELNAFTMQLHTLQKAGIPLLASLDVLEKQTRNSYFKDIIKEIVGHVQAGSNLSDALAKYPHLFSDLYINMIKAGEASGSLDEMLERLAEFGTKELDNRSRVKAALRYPLMTLGALVLAFFILVTFVVPKFSAVYSQFNTALPLPTRILLGLSFVMQRYWFMVLMLLAAIAYIFYRYINTKDGRFLWDSFKLKMPVFGPLVNMLVMSRFTRTMSILIRSGLPILQVLDLVSRTVGNVAITRAMDKIATSVREGKGIAEPMRISGLFQPMVIQMVAIGEDTGKVDELLLRVSEYYERESDYSMRNLSTMIEPIFIVILGFMVLAMAMAIFLPMWNLVRVFKR